MTQYTTMKSFKDIAYQIIKEAGKPLHYREITDVAIEYCYG